MSTEDIMAKSVFQFRCKKLKKKMPNKKDRGRPLIITVMNRGTSDTLIISQMYKNRIFIIIYSLIPKKNKFPYKKYKLFSKKPKFKN